MRIKSNSVFGIFQTRNAVQSAMDELADEGFVPSEVSILFPENASPQDLTHLKPITTASLNSGRPIDRSLDIMDEARTISVPGFGSLIAAGPDMSFLHQIENIKFEGWLSGPLMSIGVSETAAKHSEKSVRSGAFLLSTRCISDDCQKAAEQIFVRNGAIDISVSLDQNSLEDDWKSPAPGQFFQPDLSTAIVNT